MSSSATMRLRVQECACHGGNLERFVKPLLLAQVAAHPKGAHGYALLQGLAEMQGLRPDPSGAYRALRAFEAEGLVVGEADEGDSGPTRRIYRLTDSGRACLSTWIVTLRNYAEEIARVADFCERAA